MYNTLIMDNSTTPLSAKIKYQLSTIRLGVSQLLLQLTPIQRFIVVFGIICIIPGYWVMRWGTYGVLTYKYNQQKLEPHPSFSSVLPLRASPVTILKFSDDSYTAISTFTNPNSEIALSSALLHLKGFDDKGNLVYEKSQSFYLLPGQKQNLVSPIFNSAFAINKMSAEVESPHWQKRFETPTIEIEQKQTSVEVSGEKAEFEGTIINHSPFTLKEVEATYILTNNKKQTIGAVTRIEKDVRPEEIRTFPVQAKITTNDTADAIRIESSVFSNPLQADNIKF